MKSPEEIIQDTPLLVAYFSHDECNVCKVLRPKVQELTGRYKNIEFLYVNTKEHQEISGQNMVFAVPTIIVFVEGRESKRYSRHFAIEELESYLRYYETV